MTAEILSPEDQARADLYGLLARLFYEPPDAQLLRSLASAGDLPAEEETSALASGWRAIKHAAAQCDPETVKEEFDSIFIGTGKAEVTPYATAYLARTETSDGGGHPLVLLRTFLAARGLARKDGVHEPEDHIAGLCEVMRHLIGANDASGQREFFESFLAPSGHRLCDAITASQRVRFYAPVARFATAFLQLEEEVVKMD
ncbi:MAG TPA: molecular chaperone TorD family protein [Burkholderiales bacterium]|nr:molecular chaperone TorD family protein [Burkholderiales bacterium]